MKVTSTSAPLNPVKMEVPVLKTSLAASTVPVPEVTQADFVKVTSTSVLLSHVKMGVPVHNLLADLTVPV